jgi:hypothetical protein
MKATLMSLGYHPDSCPDKLGSYGNGGNEIDRDVWDSRL